MNPVTLLPTVALLWLVGCTAASPTPPADSTGAQGPGTLAASPPTFASPDEAVGALFKAATAKDLEAMTRIAGLAVGDVSTGDRERDSRQMEHFVKGYGERVKIVPDGDARARVFIGNENFPLTSPLVRVGDKWSFDAAGGWQELIARVIGENELATIGVCRAYVQAQYQYYAEDRNGDDVLQYAQHLASTAGQHDGLYWHAADGEPASPLGPLIAAARAQGFLHGSARQLDEPKPYHGYLFKILMAQGGSAPGGQYSYLINGRMVAGFALLAYPAKWNRSGVMTFLVGANGKVFQKNLGELTGELAPRMSEYSPDGSWTLVVD